MKKEQVEAVLEAFEEVEETPAYVTVTDHNRRIALFNAQEFEFDHECEVLKVVSLTGIKTAVDYDKIVSIDGMHKADVPSEYYWPWDHVRGVHNLRYENGLRKPFDPGMTVSEEEEETTHDGGQNEPGKKPEGTDNTVDDK